MTVRVLFNQGLSNVHDAIASIRAARAPNEFFVAASYTSARTPLREVADLFVDEPATNDGDRYLAWLLACCRRHAIRLVWPQSRLPLFFAHRERLEDAGIELLLPCADGATLTVLNDKQETAAVLQRHGVEPPRALPFRTAEEFDAACARLNAEFERLCVKPAISVYGRGFRVLDDSRDRFSRFLNNDVSRISRGEMRELLALNRERRLFLVMEYLAGDERSIDCLVDRGRLLRGVIRLKPAAANGRYEIIETNPRALALAAQVCEILGLNGIVNVQTRERVLADGRREQCVLEINPRMAGGIAMACQAGIALPYWALRLATGTATSERIPPVRDGLLVTSVQQAITLAALDPTDDDESGRNLDEIEDSSPRSSSAYGSTYGKDEV